MNASATSTPQTGGRLRLGYLDGLRGLAALYVVVFHISQLCHGYAETDPVKQYHAVGDWAAGPSSLVRAAVRAAHFLALGYGRFAVDVFIVLSGYVLMLPVVRAGRDSVSGGFGTFMHRRSRRILPPYFAALVLTMLLGLCIPTMRNPDPAGKACWDDCTPLFQAGPIISHLLMIQNWTPWALRLDGPMWSVAVEFQIYILFPLLMLPLRKRIGSIPTAIVFFAAGQLLCTAVQHYLRWIGADPGRFGFISAWFAGEFAIGMAAASFAFSGIPSETKLYHKAPWKPLAFFFAGMLVFFELASRKSWSKYTFLAPFRDTAWGSDWVTDLTVSLGVLCLIIHMTRQAVTGEPGLLLRLLDRRWAVRLGEFSYSLYLVHYPVMNAFDLYFRKHFGPAQTCVLAFAVSLPAAVVLSYLFHLLFEKPFMSALQKQKVPAVEAGTMPKLSNPALDPGPDRPTDPPHQPSMAQPTSGSNAPASLPTVSVVIPNFNSAKYLQRGIASVLDQGYPHLEVIVVDDLSTEDPAPALARFGDRVRLIRLDVNSGPSVARNAGAASSTGDVLAFLDADDWWPAGFLLRTAPLVRPGVAVCYDSYSVDEASLDDKATDQPTGARTMCADWMTFGPAAVDRDNMQELLTTPSLFKMVVHRLDHAAVDGFDPRYREGEDLHFFLKLVAAGRKLVVVDQPKGFYLLRPGSLLRSVETDAARRTTSLRAWWGMFRDLPLEQPLPAPVQAECGRLSQYYRARYAEATLLQRLRRGRILWLLNPTVLKAAAPAVPGILQIKARGLIRRAGSISRRHRSGQVSDRTADRSS